MQTWFGVRVSVFRTERVCCRGCRVGKSLVNLAKVAKNVGFCRNSYKIQKENIYFIKKS